MVIVTDLVVLTSNLTPSVLKKWHAFIFNPIGEVSFSTTYASKIYVNLDIDYIRSLAPKFSTMSNEVQIIKSSNVNSLPREEEMFLNRMDIKELLEAEWSCELQVLLLLGFSYYSLPFKHDHYTISWYLIKIAGIHCYSEEKDNRNR